MMNSKWEVVEVKGERVVNWKAVMLLVVKVVVSIAMAVAMFYTVADAADKEAQFNANVLDAHLSVTQRAAVIERGLR